MMLEMRSGVSNPMVSGSMAASGTVPPSMAPTTSGTGGGELTMLDTSDAMGEPHQRWSNMPIQTGLRSDAERDEPKHIRLSRLATLASWAVNWFLLAVKAFAVFTSGSKAVTASFVDSIVDLLSQGVLALAERYISKHSPNYPVGRSRLEALSVIACAFIMSMASVEVIQYSVLSLVSGFSGHKVTIYVDLNLYVILSIGVFLKFLLWVFCRRINAILYSDTIEALAEDHLNDVFSNTAAIVTVVVAVNTPAWYMDPIGAVLISLVIIYRWLGIINEQVKKIVGHTAPQEYIEQIAKLAESHDHRLAVDCCRVYHFGARYNVEMEIVLPGNMTVAESHDIALALQHKIEGLVDVERAFVHVDHQRRDGLEHKVERELATKSGKSSPNARDSSV